MCMCGNTVFTSLLISSDKKQKTKKQKKNKKKTKKYQKKYQNKKQTCVRFGGET